jgi:hypothetical protein
LVLGHDQGGLAVSRARSAVFFATLVTVLSAAPAQARPNAELAESVARAGDVVHFSISGATGGVSYDVYVDHDWVQDGDGLSGSFVVPDLGDDAWTVDVGIVIWSNGRRTVERELEYLGQALPVRTPTTPALPAPAPEAASQADAAPVPAAPPAIDRASTNPGAGAPVRPHGSRGRHDRQSPRHAASGDAHQRAAHGALDHRPRHAVGKHRKHGRHRIVCPCRFGPLTGGAKARPSLGEYSALGSIEPHAAALAAKSVATAGGGLSAAAAVPALLALAAIALTGTAVARRRHLASRPGGA